MDDVLKKAKEYIDLMYLINDNESLHLLLPEYNEWRDKCRELKLYGISNNMINATINTIYRLKAISNDAFNEKIKKHRQELIELEEKYSNLRTH